jgi:hypothetical protein
MVLKDIREIVGQFDSTILNDHYDIYTIDDICNTIPNIILLDNNQFDTIDSAVSYYIKLCLDFGYIIKWCKDINESTYQKLSKYKESLSRDISVNLITKQYRPIDCCANAMYGILFFSRAFTETENIIRFYLTIIKSSSDCLVKLISDSYI